MKKYFAISILFSGLLLGFIIKDIFHIINEDKIAVPEEKPNVLFVQHAKYAEFKKLNDSYYQLTMYDVSKNTIYFQDRPGRESGKFLTSDFISSMWHDKKLQNNFTVNPPNANLTSFHDGDNPSYEIHNEVVVLLNPKYDTKKNILTYTVTANMPIEEFEAVVGHKLYGAALFIDSVGMPLAEVPTYNGGSSISPF